MGIVVALQNALRHVPSTAVPGLVDAMLMATQSSASFTLLELLRQFQMDVQEISPGLASARAENYEDSTTNYVTAIFHLLHKNEREAEDLERVIWTVCVPVFRLRSTASRMFQVQVSRMLAEATAERSDWLAWKNNFAPLCWESLCFQLTTDRNSSSSLVTRAHANRTWQPLEKRYRVSSKHFALSGVDWNEGLLSTFSVCELIGALVTVAMDVSRCPPKTDDDLSSSKHSAYSSQNFCEDIVDMFLPPSLELLAQPSDGSVRHCAVQNLLPPLLNASLTFRWPRDVAPEGRPIGLRNGSLQEVWLCCRKLLAEGDSHRQDVYMTLAALADQLFGAGAAPSLEENGVEALDFGPVFDIRNEVEFWEELKKGLEKSSFVLRRALHGVVPSDATTAQDSTTSSSGRSEGANRRNLSRKSTWLEKEAGYLGVRAIRNKLRTVDGWRERWDAFILLHETLEEYGIHLVEAAWSHQMSFLLQFTKLNCDTKDPGLCWGSNWIQRKGCNVDVNFTWIAVLWERGFDHKNPQVRRLVMQSFLDIEWDRIRKLSSLLSENVVLGPVLEALDDPVHHKDFGLQGIYSSRTAEGASKFFCRLQFLAALQVIRRLVGFVSNLARCILVKSRGRPGLMTQSMCLEAASCGTPVATGPLACSSLEQSRDDGTGENTSDSHVLLDLFRGIVESSKHHFNPAYRAKVCGHILRAASALIILPKVQFTTLAYFLSSFPKELSFLGDSLNVIMKSWIKSAERTRRLSSSCDVKAWIVEGLQSMVETFLRAPGFSNSSPTDGDVEAWGLEADRWSRLLGLSLVDNIGSQRLLAVIQHSAYQIYSHAYKAACTPERILVAVRSLLKEFTSTQSGDRQFDHDGKSSGPLSPGDKRITDLVLSIMDEVKSFARRSVVSFWGEEQVGLNPLPAAVTGKLGGPSQRRLPADLTSAVLQGVLAISCLAECCLWCSRLGRVREIPESVVTYLWRFAWEVLTTPRKMSQTGAELHLAALEGFTFACSALAMTATSFHITAAHAAIKYESKAASHVPNNPSKMVDALLKALLKYTDDPAFINSLSRSRQAVLHSCKWFSVDSLLSISRKSVSHQQKCKEDGEVITFFSGSTLVGVFTDCLGSLESASEEYLLPLLRSVRWLMELDVLAKIEAEDDQDKYQMMWTLVQSGWYAMVDCNKRRVAPTAAFLSAIFHPSVFSVTEMHGSPEHHDECGPLKWLLNRLLDQGSRSPRTMRLTALHLTGLWLLFPETTVYYMNELKMFSLYGGESVDEELDGEIIDNPTAAREYATLIQSSDPELTEEFTNSEMYVRVTVAVMVYKFATTLSDKSDVGETNVCFRQHVLLFGRKFLLELLKATVEDSSLNKELYKKKSAIHRRKVRAWQMIGILSSFVCRQDVQQLTSLLKTCLQRNNMPSVRQYIEAFASQLFLRHPDLIEEHLISALHDFNMKAQALSSYVLIAANVITSSSSSHRDGLHKKILPAILPFMTSHHHSLRSFTQVLVYRLLRQFPFSNCSVGSTESLCLKSVADYLEENADCSRMRAVVDKHMNAFDPSSYITPRGIFCRKGGENETTKSAEDLLFECVPVALLDQIGMFLNEAREELRESMAADALALQMEKNLDCKVTQSEADDLFGYKIWSECSTPEDDRCSLHPPTIESSRNADIQKKISSLRFNDSTTGKELLYQSKISDYDAEAELLLGSIESRAKELTRMRGGRQDLIIVASLVASIPNLAGLARTCEVFKASSMVVSDVSVANDKQFQLISVTAEKWIPLVHVPEAGICNYLKRKSSEGYSVLGLEQTANSVPIHRYHFPKKVVLVLGRESDGIPVEIIQALDACLEIPQLGVIRSLNVHVSGAIALWEYTRQNFESNDQS